MRLPRSAVLVLVCLACFLATGCRASKPFIEGVSRAVPLMERDLRHYAGDDRDRQGEVDALKAIAADRDAVAVEPVDAAWQPVRSWYVPAVEADPRLNDLKRAVRRSTVQRLDALIAEERARPLRLP